MSNLRMAALIFALAGVPELAWAQQAPNQSVTLADLAGTIIETRVVSDQLNRKEGKEFSQRVQNDLKLEIGPEGKINGILQATLYQSGRTFRLKPENISGLLERPGEINVSGPGHSVWIFDDGVVTFLRTLVRGGFKREIKFARGASGITCVANEGFAREEGGGSIVLKSFDGKPFTVLSAKPTSSNCRVLKAK